MEHTIQFVVWEVFQKDLKNVSTCSDGSAVNDGFFFSFHSPWISGPQSARQRFHPVPHFYQVSIHTVLCLTCLG